MNCTISINYPALGVRERALRRLLFTLLCTCGLALCLSGQELSRSVVGSAGTYFSAVNVGNIHWTVGEIAVDRTQNGITLERGFHHGLYDLLSTSVWTSPDVQLELAVYPNPTADRVHLSGDWLAGDELLVHDLLGRRILTAELPPERHEFELGTYPSGTYLLTITRAGQPLKSLRIVRQ